MKILLVHSFYNHAGGEDRVVQIERDLLARNGDEVYEYFRRNSEIDGVLGRARAALGATFNVVSAIKLARRIREIRPDVVHVHNFFPTISPSVFYVCRALGTPVVLTLHNYRVLCPTAFLYPDPALRERSLHRSAFWTVSKRTYQGSLAGTLAVATMVEAHKAFGTWRHMVDAFVALSPAAKEKFIEGGLPAEKIWVKPNSVGDLSVVAEEQPRRGALFVGRLSAEKGIDTLLQAWEGATYPLTVVGDGPMRDAVERSASAGRLRYKGPLSPDNVRAEMRQAELLVLPSEWNEMFPMTVAEAFAESLPVIAAAVPGMRAMIEDAGAGACYEPGDASGLANLVRAMSEAPAQLRVMGERAREIYLAQYSQDVSYRILTDIYRAVSETRRKFK